MKRLICVLASLVLAVTVVAVRPAGATYGGFITRTSPDTFEVQGTVKMSITVLSVTSKGRLNVEEVLVLGGNVVNVQVRTIPRDAERLIFKLDTPTNGSAVFKAGQGQKVDVLVEGTRR